MSRLRPIIRELLDTEATRDPRELARLAVARLSGEELREELTDAATNVAREVMHSVRTQRPQNSPAGQSDAETHVRVAGRAQHIPSPKIAALRSWAQQQLDTGWHIGESVWKKLRDCTLDDLAEMMSERRNQALTNALEADRIERLQKACEAAGVSTPGELSEDAFTEAWTP